MQVELFFDPVCPYCWVTAQWVRQVTPLRGLDVRWRFISLAFLNDAPGAYDDRPEGYPEAHHNGLRLLRVAAAARADHGDGAVDRLYRAMGDHLWETALPEDQRGDGFAAMLRWHAQQLPLAQLLAAADLPAGLADAADDEQHDVVVRGDTEAALARVGDDVGTPILTIDAPDGPSFFGPVIAGPPSDPDQAATYWDAFVTLARWPGLAELKRSQRTAPVTALTRSAGLVGSDSSHLH